MANFRTTLGLYRVERSGVTFKPGPASSPSLFARHSAKYVRPCVFDSCVRPIFPLFSVVHVSARAPAFPATTSDISLLRAAAQKKERDRLRSYLVFPLFAFCSSFLVLPFLSTTSFLATSNLDLASACR